MSTSWTESLLLLPRPLGVLSYFSRPISFASTEPIKVLPIHHPGLPIVQLDLKCHPPPQAGMGTGTLDPVSGQTVTNSLLEPTAIA